MSFRLSIANVVGSLCIGTFWLVLAASCQGLVFDVNVRTDSVDINPGDGICATEQGDCSLRAAVQESNASEGVDTIDLPVVQPPSIYSLTVLGPDEDEAASGDLDIRESVTIRGSGNGRILVDSTPNDRIFDILAPAIARIENLVLQDGNLLSGDGGAIRNQGTVVLNSMTISDSQAEQGGGLANGVDAVASLLNVTVSGNSATGQGGGIVNDGTLSLHYVTIADNSTGVFNLGTLILANTLLSGNTGSNCGGREAISEGYNLEDRNTCFFGDPTDLVNMDPLLLPLQSVGGNSSTHPLQLGSPAIDAGSNENCPPTDQRGLSRPADGDDDDVAVCDIGAYEALAMAPSPTPTITATGTSTATPTETPLDTPTPDRNSDNDRHGNQHGHGNDHRNSSTNSDNDSYAHDHSNSDRDPSSSPGGSRHRSGNSRRSGKLPSPSLYGRLQRRRDQQ